MIFMHSKPKWKLNILSSPLSLNKWQVQNDWFATLHHCCSHNSYTRLGYLEWFWRKSKQISILILQLGLFNKETGSRLTEWWFHFVRYLHTYIAKSCRSGYFDPHRNAVLSCEKNISEFSWQQRLSLKRKMDLPFYRQDWALIIIQLSNIVSTTIIVLRVKESVHSK